MPKHAWPVTTRTANRREKTAAWAIAVLIFAAPGVAQWTADAATGTTPDNKPATVQRVGWDCTTPAGPCGTGTGTRNLGKINP